MAACVGACQVLLHKGLLYNPTFGAMVLEASRQTRDNDGTGSELTMTKVPSIASSHSGGERQGLAWKQLLTVNADTSFVYPGHEFYTVLHGQGLGTEDLGPDVGPHLVDAYKAIFKKISMPFSCSHGAEPMLQQQAKEISKRLLASMDGGVMSKTATGRGSPGAPTAMDLLSSVSPGSVRNSFRQNTDSKDLQKQLSPAMRPTCAPDPSDLEAMAHITSDSDSEARNQPGDPGAVMEFSRDLFFELPQPDDAQHHSF